MPVHNIHVIPTGQHGWVVEVEGEDEASAEYLTQDQAVAAGTEKAKEDGVALFIHGRNGKIRERYTYSKDTGLSMVPAASRAARIVTSLASVPM